MDWSKLGSRKFWIALAGFAASIIAEFGIGDGEVQKIAGLITAFGTVVTYLLVQGNVDAKQEEKKGESDDE